MGTKRKNNWKKDQNHIGHSYIPQFRPKSHSWQLKGICKSPKLQQFKKKGLADVKKSNYNPPDKTPYAVMQPFLWILWSWCHWLDPKPIKGSHCDMATASPLVVTEGPLSASSKTLAIFSLGTNGRYVATAQPLCAEWQTTSLYLSDQQEAVGITMWATWGNSGSRFNECQANTA